MKSEKKVNLNKKKLGIIILAIVLILVIILIKLFSNSKNTELQLDEFEKIAVYRYLENDLLSIENVYRISGKSDYNEIEIFQSKLKQALDRYFVNNSDTEVESSVILENIDSKYIPDNIDFHGILVSDYEYNFEKNTFVKSPGANSALAGIESMANVFDYSNEKVSIQKIEKTNDTQYNVYFNIINSVGNNNTVLNTGNAILEIKNNDLNINSCTIN